MIRLIASDIDGTLLNDKKELPQDFEQMLDMLEERNIAFAVSSGRSYSALISQFGNYADRVSFICDNGAYIVFNGERISISVIPKETVDEIIGFCNDNDLTVLLCGVNGTYYSCSNATHAAEVAIYYNNAVFMNDLFKCSDDIFKISVFEESGIEDHGNVILNERFGNRMNVTLSGRCWTDLMNAGINKGSGLRVIQSQMGVSSEESAAFGDFLNDIEMLESVGYSFAMENAHPKCKAVAKSVIGSNNDGAVTKEIKRLVQVK